MSCRANSSLKVSLIISGDIVILNFLVFPWVP